MHICSLCCRMLRVSHEPALFSESLSDPKARAACPRLNLVQSATCCCTPLAALAAAEHASRKDGDRLGYLGQGALSPSNTLSLKSSVKLSPASASPQFGACSCSRQKLHHLPGQAKPMWKSWTLMLRIVHARRLSFPPPPQKKKKKKAPATAARTSVGNTSVDVLSFSGAARSRHEHSGCNHTASNTHEDSGH